MPDMPQPDTANGTMTDTRSKEPSANESEASTLAEQNIENVKVDQAHKLLVSCPYCSDIAFGILGLDIQQPAQMCSSCRQARVCITSCPGHIIVPQGGLKSESSTSKRRMIVCLRTPVTAFKLMPGIVCVKHRRLFDAQLNQLSPDMQGHQNHPRSVVAMNREKDPQYGCRADVGYLLPGSELCKQLRRAEAGVSRT
ncbi:hypothetical protein BDV12DRAFT_175602 [Aspergillus spectabilis]